MARLWFGYKLYPNRRQRELLLKCLEESRLLYNEMLEQVKGHHRKAGSFLFKYDLTGRFKGRGGGHVSAPVVQTLADRLDKVIRRFLALLSAPLRRTPAPAKTA